MYRFKMSLVVGLGVLGVHLVETWQPGAGIPALVAAGVVSAAILAVLR